jgi:hypothetical protein
MSATDSPGEMEWKTIRISGISYYKLVELDGFLTVLLGSQPIPLSTVAEWAIYVYYDSLHDKLGKILSDPELRKHETIVRGMDKKETRIVR